MSNISRPSKRSVQSRPVIHVSIRSKKITSSVKKNASIRRYHSSSDQFIHKSSIRRIINSPLKLPNKITNVDFNSTLDEQDSPLSQSKMQSNYSSKSLTIKDTWANPNDYVKNHFRNNKKKKTAYKKCLITTLMFLFIAIVAITVLLVLLLLKSKSKKELNTNTSPILRWKTTGITIAGVTNQFGATSDKLNNPYGLALDWSNTLYISDARNNRVQKYLRGASFGETIAGQANGSGGSTNYTLLFPTDVALKINGDIYVVDRNNNRVQLWTSGSSTGVTVAGTAGSVGNANNQFNGSFEIARDPIADALYITDRLNHRVMRYTSNNSFGTIAAGGNGQGTNSNQLYEPIGIHFDAISNSLFIANFGANNVVRWTLGASNWEIIAGNENGTSSTTSTGFSRTTNVVLDPMGNVYIVDYGNHRIQFFSVGERNGTTIAGMTGMIGSNATLFNFPFSMTLDNQLNLYVSDRNNNRVQKFMRY